jgi:Tat protein secretion system quality control protein TatD with DNase activity
LQSVASVPALRLDGTSEIYELIDAHCHLQLEPLMANTGAALANSVAAGLSAIVVCGTHPGPDWARVAMLHEANPQLIKPQFGLHPWWIPGTLGPNTSGALHMPLI